MEISDGSKFVLIFEGPAISLIRFNTPYTDFVSNQFIVNIDMDPESENIILIVSESPETFI